jgi:hypothetical protein
MALMLSEIIKKTCELKTREEKVAWLKQNDSRPLQDILIAMYDKKKIKFLIPNTEPPYTPSPAHENQGALFREARKLKYFVEGFGGENVAKIKREQIFIDMLETVHRDDAKLLIDMIKQQGYKGLTVKVINEAFGNIINVEESNVQEG